MEKIGQERWSLVFTGLLRINFSSAIVNAMILFLYFFCDFIETREIILENKNENLFVFLFFRIYLL